VRTKEEKLALRRAWWHKTKEAKREKRNAYRRNYHHRTKKQRAEILKLQNKTNYWRHREKSLERNKAWCKKNPDRLVIHNITKKLKGYGITIAIYNRMLEEQRGVCAICFKKCKSGRSLSVDHCHKTGKVRALLCGNCNQGLGSFCDDIKNIERALEYLKKHTTAPETKTEELDVIP